MQCQCGINQENNTLKWFKKILLSNLSISAVLLKTLKWKSSLTSSWNRKTENGQLYWHTAIHTHVY